MAATMQSATVVCDRADEAALLVFILRQIGVTSTQTSSLESAMRAFVQNPSDLLVLSLHDTPPLAQVRRVRQESEAPVVLISSVGDEDILCEALQAGTDEIALRPFSARLLAARIQALLRRGRGTSLRLFPSMTLGDISLDPSTRSVSVQGLSHRRLTHLEFRLLHTLMLHRDQTVPLEMIVEHVWGYDGEGDRELVRGLVRRLRAKVEPDPSVPQYILSIPGLGYRLEIRE